MHRSFDYKNQNLKQYIKSVEDEKLVVEISVLMSIRKILGESFLKNVSEITIEKERDFFTVNVDLSSERASKVAMIKLQEIERLSSFLSDFEVKVKLSSGY